VSYQNECQTTTRQKRQLNVSHKQINRKYIYFFLVMLGLEVLDPIHDSVAFCMVFDANGVIAAMVKTTNYTSVWIVRLLWHY